jgi:hypothetical protein
LACRSSPASRSRVLIRSRSSVDACPGRARPGARELRSVSPEQPILAAIERIAPDLRVVLALVLQHHPHRALADLGGEGWGSLRHGSSLSRVGASEHPGAVHGHIVIATAGPKVFTGPRKDQPSVAGFADARRSPFSTARHALLAPHVRPRRYDHSLSGRSFSVTGWFRTGCFAPDRRIHTVGLPSSDGRQAELRRACW